MNAAPLFAFVFLVIGIGLQIAELADPDGGPYTPPYHRRPAVIASRICLAIAALLLAVTVFSRPAAAAEPPALVADTELPHALNAAECAAVGSIAWSARALHQHGVEHAVARKVLQDIYHGGIEPLERIDAYIDAAMRFSASPLGAGFPPGVVGNYVNRQCHKFRGDLNLVFGKGS